MKDFSRDASIHQSTAGVEVSPTVLAKLSLHPDYCVDLANFGLGQEEADSLFRPVGMELTCMLMDCSL